MPPPLPRLLPSAPAPPPACPPAPAPPPPRTSAALPAMPVSRWMSLSALTTSFRDWGMKDWRGGEGRWRDRDTHTHQGCDDTYGTNGWKRRSEQSRAKIRSIIFLQPASVNTATFSPSHPLSLPICCSHPTSLSPVRTLPLQPALLPLLVPDDWQPAHSSGGRREHGAGRGRGRGRGREGTGVRQEERRQRR